MQRADGRQCAGCGRLTIVIAPAFFVPVTLIVVAAVSMFIVPGMTVRIMPCRMGVVTRGCVTVL